MTATTATPKVIRLEDYTPLGWRVESLALSFALDETQTQVSARLRLAADAEIPGPLVLNGEHLQLVSVALDGRALGAAEYQLDAETLTLPALPRRCELEVVTRINPAANTALEGLYVSGGNFCTQCEAEGFRRITYYPDRPDVMTVYTTRIEADKAKYPVLLCNGNPLEQGELPDGRHYAVWHDPFPKPSYLFALVAGDLACVEDSFTTASGRQVALRIYVQHGNEDKCGHAMASLQRAMRWDEEVYGREYDLDIYMIVAVDDFNMGAMENKGLNVFNSRYVLAKPETATDQDFVAVEGVIAHEYFHNWSGNRVTCRDWFQLSLKEGFTVFRDQQFTGDMTSQAVTRIGEVNLLRNHQFREDAGPMAHPVRPASYVEINNFYTVTVYNKGAEVVRMLHTLLGAARFRQGTDLYFERHDGQAVTTDDFVRALEDANGIDLSQFRRWYSQAGTPQLTVTGEHDAAARTFTLRVRQNTPPTPGQPEKQPFHIPLAVGLLDADGRELPLQLAGEAAAQGASRVLSVSDTEQAFTFVNIDAQPVPSLLRNFSAPVKLDYPYTDAELALLMAHDGDPFNRWEAGQRLAVGVMLRLLEAREAGRSLSLDPGFSTAFAQTLQDPRLDRALIAQAISLPEEEYLAEFLPVVDPQAIHEVREFLRHALAEAHHAAFQAVFARCADAGPYQLDAEAMGRRRLKNQCLSYLMLLGDEASRGLGAAQYERADNMTDVMAALSALAHNPVPEGPAILEDFYRRWRHDPLVLDKWFAIQASAPLPDTLEQVRALTRHADFTLRNPNRLRSLVGTFTQRNPARFHDPSGAGYEFLAGIIEQLDPLNPQVAARMMSPFTQWRRFDAARQALMKQALERILARPKLSKDVYEIAAKSLGGAA